MDFLYRRQAKLKPEIPLIISLKEATVRDPCDLFQAYGPKEITASENLSIQNNVIQFFKRNTGPET